jgi:hypothetical protein
LSGCSSQAADQSKRLDATASPELKPESAEQDAEEMANEITEEEVRKM